ncbi:MAG: hypothetical protein H0V61_06060 [Chitinophagales bacterium]|nr:hypothetical protein [Chitinophagales bacterium]
MKLKFSAIQLNNKYVYKHDINPTLLREIIEHSRRKSLQGNAAIFCYSHALLLQLDQDPKNHLKELQQSMTEHSDSIDEDDLRILSKLTENYCVRQINKGLHEYYEMLYQLMTDRFSRESKLSAVEFKNFITICLRSEKAGEVLKFIDESRGKIFPDEIREDAVNYAMARYYFHEKDYNHVLKLLQQVSYFDPFYKIDSKKLLIQTYYELEEWDSLESAMNAFRVFIHRNKAISEVHKLNNQNFINLLFQLIPLHSGQSKKLLKLKNTIAKKEALAERDWLLKKMAVLERQPKKSYIGWSSL